MGRWDNVLKGGEGSEGDEEDDDSGNILIGRSRFRFHNQCGGCACGAKECRKSSRAIAGRSPKPSTLHSLRLELLRGGSG
jgi:hypothetical protein